MASHHAFQGKGKTSLRSKRLRLVSEQTTRDESQRPRQKWRKWKSREGVALVSFLALSRTKMPFLGLPLLRSQGKTQLDGFARTGALIWNGLPKSLKSFSKSQFKSQIKQILLRFLQKTDDYIGVPQILCDISKWKCYNILPILSELFHSFPCLPPISFNIKLISVTLQTSFCIVIFYVDKLSLLF